MFSRPTVFVIGAGASAEFRMPVGGDLKGRVAAALTTSFDGIRSRLLVENRWPEDKITAHAERGAVLARVIEKFPSIDEALYFYSGDKELIDIGKIAVADEIVKAERNSNLYGALHGNESLRGNCQQTWARHFLELAMSATRLSDINRLFANVTVIDFNYDRVFEHYIYWALQQEIGISPDTAAECVSSLKVLRPYGSIGPLDWQNRDGTEFGGEGLDLFSVSNQIRTYTEEAQSEDIRNIKSAIDAARTIVILGFGYHKQNIDVLSLAGGTNPRRIFMTTYGIPEENYAEIQIAVQNCMQSHLSPQYYNHGALTFMIRLRPSLVMAVS